MLFVDVFPEIQDPMVDIPKMLFASGNADVRSVFRWANVKIINPIEETVDFAPLRDFGESECIALARKLRQHYSEKAQVIVELGRKTLFDVTVQTRCTPDA